VSVPAYEVVHGAGIFTVCARDNQGREGTSKRRFHDFDELDVKVGSDGDG
jgi:hypothetical protein